jgi:hypothetical protein
MLSDRPRFFYPFSGFGTGSGYRVFKKSLSGFVLSLRAGAFTLYDGSGRRINLIQLLRGLKPWETADLEVFYKLKEKLVPLRICAIRKDKSSEREGLDRLKQENRKTKQGREVSKVQAEYNKKSPLQTAEIFFVEEMFVRVGFTTLNSKHCHNLTAAAAPPRLSATVIA